MSSSIESLISREYEAGFVTDIESDTFPPGLNEDVVRAISARKNEPAFMLEWRLKAYRRWLTMKEPHWPNVHYNPIDYQAVSYYSAPEDEEASRQSRRGRSRAAEDLPAARHSADGAEDPLRRRGGRDLRFGLGRHDDARGAVEARDHLLLVGRSDPRAFGARGEVPRLRRSLQRQFLRRVEQCRLLRRLVRVRTKRRALPDRAVDVLPHQLGGHGPVRADADRRRRGLVRELPRGMHGAQAQHEPAARRGRRDHARSRERRRSTRPSRTGTPATRKAAAASSTS